MLNISIDLHQWFIKSFLLTYAGTSTHTGMGIDFENQQLVKELHKPVIRNLRKRKVYSSFKDKIILTACRRLG